MLFFLTKLKIPDFDLTDNIDEYINSPDPLKIAFIQHESINIPTDLSVISKVSKNVFYSCDHPHWLNVVDLAEFKNVYWVIPGEFKNQKDVKSIFWNHWMNSVVSIYQNNTKWAETLNLLRPFDVKEKHFDCLLGNSRRHRDLISKLISEENIFDKMVFTYIGDSKNTREWKESDLILSSTRIEAKYFNLPVSDQMYDKVLINLYNKSSYTIVNETISDNNILLVSEKIAKPIIGKRLFIVFTGAGYLKKLQDLGFRTFHTLIDETYDKIYDEEKRFKAAIEQVKYLCSIPQDEVLKQVRPIVEHNFQILMNTNWEQILIDDIKKCLE